MTKQRALAILLTSTTLSLTAASPARAETEEPAPPPRPRVLVWSGDGHERRDPVLGLPLAGPATYLSPTAKLDVTRTPAPSPILSSGERTIIIVAAAIVGVVLIVAVAGAS